MRRPVGRTAAGLLCVALGGVEGCFSYASTPIAAATPRTLVRVALSEAGTLRLQRVVGPGVHALLGRVTTRESDHLVLAVDVVERRDYGMQTLSGEAVDLHDADVDSVALRRVSRGKTTLAVAAGVSIIMIVRRVVGNEPRLAGPITAATPASR